jgi:hypothetical protein
VSDSNENPHVADESEREQLRMRPRPTVRDAPPETGPPELLQPEYPPDILPMLVMKATGDAHAAGDPANYPPPPPPPDDTASGDEPIVPQPPPASAPPGNVDVPYVSQDGDTLNCTMGNWTNEPTAYSYNWQLDDSPAGSDSPDLTVTVDDVGKTATCTVTATNGAGSTAAPPSVGLDVAAFT